MRTRRGYMSMGLLLAGMLAARCALAATPRQDAPHGAAVHAVLDRDAPMPERKAALQQLHEDAEHGNAFAQLLLGALYFQGPQGAHALLPRDPALAEVYLSNAAVHGNVFAMAAMAELELQQHHVLQANVWAQLYVHYGVPPDDLKHATYAAILMHRTWPRLPKAEEQTAVDDINAFIRAHNASILAGQRQTAARQSARELADPACRLVSLHPDAHHAALGSGYDGVQPGIALYWIGVDARGRARAVEPILSLPDRRVQRRMRDYAASWRATPAPRCGKPLRYALLPVEFNRGMPGTA